MSTAALRTRGDITDLFAPAIRSVAIVMVAGGIAGAIAGGVGSRLVMRIAAITAPERTGHLTENGNVVGEITAEGTLFLLVFAGLATTFIAAGTYLIARPWLPRRRLVRGLALGGLLLAVFGPAVLEPSNADFVILGDRAQNVALFGALYLLTGLLLVATEGVVDRVVPHRRPERPLAGLVTAEAVVGAFAVPAIALAIAASISTLGLDDLVPALARGGALAALLGLGLGRALARDRGAPRAERGCTVAGAIALTVAAASGAAATVGAITTIV